MTTVTCNLAADELAAQLDRYRALGRHAGDVDYESGRVVVRFADDPPRALIERTLEVERGCCPFFEIDYEPAGQRLAISVDQPDRHPSLEMIADALGKSRSADPTAESTQAQMRTALGVISCCSPSALETCCEPQHKQECCGQSPSSANTLAAPSRCGCDT